jgi:predicted ATP-grasp superfamily ATP-dependent carboligase
MKGTVLVIDGHWNKSVAAIRSLSKAGLQVWVSETSRLAAGMLSRYPQKRFLTPSPITAPDDFLETMLDIVRQHKPDVLLPMELTTQLLLSAHRHHFSPHTRFPFGEHQILIAAASKIKATQAAQECGLTTPDSLPVQSDTSARAVITTLGSSLVLKPDFGEGGRGLCYCKTEEELTEVLAQMPRGSRYLAQQRIPQGGSGIGVSILMDEQQQVLASFSHKRLREYPIGGGPSTCRTAISHPQGERDAIRLLTHLQFQGVAMVEFKEDPTSGTAVFLEINPRFWGSLPLAIQAGVDFPTLVYKWGMGIDFPKPEPVIGTRSRNLLPGDLLHFISKRGHVSRDFWDLRHTPDDLFSLQDPGPVLGRIISPLVALYDPQLKSVFKKRESQ